MAKETFLAWQTTLRMVDWGWGGRDTLGGLGQRCGELIAQSYAAGLPSHTKV